MTRTREHPADSSRNGPNIEGSHGQRRRRRRTTGSDLAKATDVRRTDSARASQKAKEPDLFAVKADASTAAIQAAAIQKAPSSVATSANGGSAVPTPRIETRPADPLDYDDRHETRATSDDRVLARYLKLRWHQVAQRLVVGICPVALGFTVHLLCRWGGMPPSEATRIGIYALLAGGIYIGLPTAGRVLRHRGGQRSGDPGAHTMRS